MRKFHRSVKKLLHLIIPISAIFFIANVITGCNNNPSNQQNNANETSIDSTVIWFSWNLFFKGGEDSAARAKGLDSLEEGIRQYLLPIAPHAVAIFKRRYCPCDSSLVNLDVSLAGTASGTPTPPPTKPYPGPSGDFVLSKNIPMEKLVDSNEKKMAPMRTAFDKQVPDPKGIVIGVIDTGIDTALFSSRVMPFIWTDPMKPTATLFNFLDGVNTADFKDDSRVAHGSVVTSLIWRSYSQKRRGPSPRIMVLKAFDREGAGTVFSVSCALSYAIQKKVSLINASWGYFGDPDSVMNHFVNLAAQASIPIIVAAGNTPRNQRPLPDASCLDSLNPMNHLTNDHLFFPAGWSDTMRNMISVTGINIQDTPCFYQNYSSQYVTVGVKNRRRCCVYNIGGDGNQANTVEGTSFATPIITGRIGAFLAGNHQPGDSRSYLVEIELRSITQPKPWYTVNGQYIIYEDR